MLAPEDGVTVTGWTSATAVTTSWCTTPVAAVTAVDGEAGTARECLAGGSAGALRCLTISGLPDGVLDGDAVPVSVPPVAWATPDPVASAAPNPRVTAPTPSQP